MNDSETKTSGSHKDIVPLLIAAFPQSHFLLPPSSGLLFTINRLLYGNDSPAGIKMHENRGFTALFGK